MSGRNEDYTARLMPARREPESRHLVFWQVHALHMPPPAVS